MKKLIAFALIIFTLALALASCAGENTPDATTYNYYTSKITPTAATTVNTSATAATEATTPTATTATATATTIETTPAMPFVPSGYAPTMTNMLETRSKVLIFEAVSASHPKDVVYYYSIADGEFYPFCFDPFCDHKAESSGGKPVFGCVGNALYDRRARQPGEKCAYINSRIYFVYFDAIYSCSEFATDTRVEYSFQEYDSLTYDEIMKRGNAGIYPICNFESDGASIFFKHIDEKGNLILYRYDTSSRKLIDLTAAIKKAEEKVGVSLYARYFANGTIYLDGYKNVTKVENYYGNQEVTGEFVAHYAADHTLSVIEETDFEVPTFPMFETDEGYIVEEYGDGTNQNTLYYIKFSGEKITLIDDTEKTLGGSMPQFLYKNGKYLYYYVVENVLIGKNSRGKDVYNNNGGKIYRFDTESGKIELVFDDVNYNISHVFYVGESEAVMTVYKYTKNARGEVETSSSLLIKAALDANGNFIDIEEVELE